MSSHNHTRKSVPSLVTLLPNIITQCLFPRPTRIDGPSEGSPIEERSTHRQEESDGLRGLSQAIIDKLPDDALLDIFDFYLGNDDSAFELRNADKWHALVHVCRQWRNVVFSSPRRLNLALLCGEKTPVRAMLDIWPVLPMEIEKDWTGNWGVELDNIIAALEHRDRVRSIILLHFPGSVWKTLAAAMQAPFPKLTYLWLLSGGYGIDLPASFLGGSAPRLRTFRLSDIRSLAVRSLNLLSSASDLVDLNLSSMPYTVSEYISPESMVAYLSSLNRLETFHLEFNSRQYRPCPPPHTRVVLPALNYLAFEGANKYSEDLVSRIDTPKLGRLDISVFLDSVFDIPELKQFIGRAKSLKPFKVAKVAFDRSSIQLKLDHPHDSVLRIFGRIDRPRQVSSMTLVCRQLFPFFALIERLDLILTYPRFESQREDAIESTQFLDLFRPFTSIQSLYVSERLVSLVAPVLRERIGERATEVLPNLRDLFLGGYVTSRYVQGAIQPLLVAQQLSDQPIVFHHWDREEG